jgi:hypothetical protein
MVWMRELVGRDTLMGGGGSSALEFWVLYVDYVAAMARIVGMDCGGGG